MDIYILDSLYRREVLVDKYVSLIWTERFSKWGDFELVLISNSANRSRFKTGLNITIQGSYRVMTIETIEETTNDQGEFLLTVKGRSLERIFENRIARAALSDLTADPKWIITDQPADIVRKLFHDICVTGVLDPGDIISGVTEASIFPVDTIPEPSEAITYEIDPKPLYIPMTELCDQYGMGFRLVRDIMNPQLYFDVYMGSDRTSKQTTLPAVIFSPTMENLHSPTELRSIAPMKNVAYVISPVGHEVVYPLGMEAVEGFERHVLLVKADDITDTDPEVASAQMIQRGKEELAKNRAIRAFDGELRPNGQFIYQRDYYLGDLVEERSVSGTTSNMQVTEQIFASDGEGDRTYPTLSVNQFITPGSWAGWDVTEVWEDVDPDMEWDDLP